MSEDFEIDRDIENAIEEVLSDAELSDDVSGRLSALVKNCLTDNYDSSDVKSVIDQVALRQSEGGDEESQGEDANDAD